MKTEREKMLSGETYDCADDELISRWHLAKRLQQQYNTTDSRDRAAQEAILDQLLGRYGENVWIAAPFFVDYGENIHLGCHVEINMNCVMLDCNRIVIGDYCGIGPGVHIYTVMHPVNAHERLSGTSRFWKSQTAPVTLGNNVWVGGGAIILPGITIADNTTIGAGSVVTQSIPANCLAAGNPCRVIKTL